MVFIDNKMETGNFFDLLEAGISFGFRNLRLSGEVKGLLREEKLEIPDEALREALTNALCHRQYERTNGSVSLAIYDDRVEIVNPGTFPPQLTEESIRSNHESYPYNSQLTLSDFSHCRKVRTILQPLVTLYLPNRTHTCKPVECFF